MIAVENLALRAGDFTLSDVSFRVAAGGYAALMGRTGSGKTSLLEAICGLRAVVGGRVIVQERDVTGAKPAARGVGYVPQDGALFRTITVAGHLSFALEVRKWEPDRTARRVGELAELLGISHLMRRTPHGLSGGERQRVALGRALSARPGVLLLDEPLSALDDDTRKQMYSLLKRVQEHEHVTVLHVTHSRSEARALADVVLRLVEGQVMEATPDGSD
ncbi:ATP-binding cassette domain-containing protein [Candidatus Poribacteria bacterium]|jgi:molybdate/tungstate transport system ATP-binding protein|nr:ATP-binding cassette domain-containing protein [Candidatus Poribacteria bacterium]MBT5531857.1 ATP-binding cassette domain-containing protein [Candidatus Poribacteria bacterium]MBT5711711.1 ATP-binding cassette domain-containing protein [Candidatus Poribacteria bacterium]MBT7097242.1 ATP-binding cassette domain-containing protein [Candidatus Poribacteria bacterium]MBT7806341.1 ATP-binding cassette domain-containing protein [Candidatus Poribacteria bacterium]